MSQQSNLPDASFGTAPTLQPDQADRPMRELLVELWQNTEKLFRQEAKLASTELDSKITRVKSDLKADVSAAAIGGAAVYAGLLAIVAGVILLLSNFMAPWLSAILVGGAIVGVGYALLQKRKRTDATELVPTRTIQNVKQDVRTFREAVR